MNDPGPQLIVAGAKAVALLDVDANGNPSTNNGRVLQITDVSY